MIAPRAEGCVYSAFFPFLSLRFLSWISLWPPELPRRGALCFAFFIFIFFLFLCCVMAALRAVCAPCYAYPLRLRIVYTHSSTGLPAISPIYRIIFALISFPGHGLHINIIIRR